MPITPIPTSAIVGGVKDILHGSASTILTTATQIYGPFLLGGFLVFEVLRRCFPKLYTCQPTSVPGEGVRWIPHVWTVTDDKIMEVCGLDTLIFFRFLRMGKHLAAFAVILSIGLFPAYSSTKLLEQEDFIDRLTISGLPRNDPRLWATVFAAVAMTLFTMYSIARECQVYKERRHQFLAKASTQQYSVLIDDIPEHLRSHAALKRYFHAIFPNQVEFCYIAVECRALERQVAMRESVRNALEHALVVLHRTSRRPTHWEWRTGDDGWWWCFSVKTVDSIATYEAKLHQLNNDVLVAIREIEAQQKHGSFRFNNPFPDHIVDAGDPVTPPLATSNEATPLLRPSADVLLPLANLLPDLSSPKEVLRRSAFVTFSTLQATNTVQQVVQTATPHEMQIQEAPPAQDIVWANVGTYTYEQRDVFALVAIAATAALILFWTVPTTLVVALSSVDSLRRVVPHLNELLDSFPWLESLLQQLSPLGLVVMNSLAPLLLRVVACTEGHASHNAIEASVFSKVVAFQLVQTFFVASVAGSLSAIADKIQLIVQEPLQVIPMLGRSIPGQSTLFVSFILVQTGLGLVLQLLRVVPIVSGGVYWLFSPNLTRREQSAPWWGLTPATVSTRFDFTTTLAQLFLVFVLVLTFAPLAPVVSVAGGIFFVVADTVYRRQLLCVYVPTTHSTGLHWPQLYSFLITGMLISQGTLVGVLTLKQAPSPAAMALVLMGLTALFHSWIRKSYPSVSEFLPVEVCVALDAQRRRSPSAPLLDRSIYKQPAMTQKAPLAPEL
ncbi:hypothetical protein H257_08213 [Aphanomyces astaci]|uniref:CSC1/OSCA1-like 7TM region domain-containing protein n=2 Tax=Aphanomyces astaci TaxID=112090 RepID=W4GG90_APHAT|nr:hypothetical protein H257_08213 [Aphanomyces astaci]ETV77988.1 hypothetical protein H257_08213 [Aphanomyces astaci]|eukprot:XP_009832326.1 hypothetical protein H257_08213 [Aphanomyces astaci]